MGCSSYQKPFAKPADLIQPCQKLTPFAGKDMGALLRYTINLTKVYKVCSARHDALAKL